MRKANKIFRNTENHRIISTLVKGLESNPLVGLGVSKITDDALSAPMPLAVRKPMPVKTKMDILELISSLVRKAQPWLIVLIFIAQFYKKKW